MESECINHSLLPEYNPTTDVRNFKIGEDYETIRSSLLAARKLFEDPVDSSNKNIEWKRPTEIYEKPCFILEKPSRFDALQGKEGDCWLVAAIEALTLNEDLIQWVVPPDQNFDRDYIGAFHFRLWRLGTWYNVIVDDRLPYDKRANDLYGVQSMSGYVFWASLLEKAYAKFCGRASFYADPVRYDLLTRGYELTSLQDLSGCIPEKVLDNYLPKGLTLPEYLLRVFLQNALITCSFKEKLSNVGLKNRHTYCITRVYKCKDNHKEYSGLYLIRIMNPWGHAEWTGEWSDDNWKKIDKKIREELEFEVDDDGEFWMSEKDFLKHYAAVYICHLGPAQYVLCRHNFIFESWRTISFRGEWVKDVTAGGSDRSNRHMNPQCRFILNWRDTENEGLSVVVIAITHWSKSGRTFRDDVGFYVYSLNKEDANNRKKFKKKFFRDNYALNEDDMDFDKSYKRAFVRPLRLDCPGEYLIVPCTKKPKFESQFLLRVFTESSSERWEHRYAKVSPQGSVEESKSDEKEIKRIFDNVANGKHEINWTDLSKILEKAMNPKYCYFEYLGSFIRYIRDIYGMIMGSDDFETATKSFSKEGCRSMIAVLDDDNSGKIDYTEFRNLWNKIRFWTEVYERHKDETEGLLPVSQLRDALSSMGSDVDTRTVHSLTYIYANERNLISLTDFILCGVNLETAISRYNKIYIDIGKEITISREDWIKNILIL